MIACPSKCQRFEEVFHFEQLLQHEPSEAAKLIVEEDVPFDSGKIMNLMEFMALSRIEAINLLTQYNGNIDEIFATLLM